MNWKTKLKSPSFWTGIGGAVVMLLRAFGVEMGGDTAEGVISLVCSALVAIGIFKNAGSAKESIKKVTDIADTLADLPTADLPTDTNDDEVKTAEKKAKTTKN